MRILSQGDDFNLLCAAVPVLGSSGISVAGLVLDILGFLVIVKGGRDVAKQEMERNEAALAETIFRAQANSDRVIQKSDTPQARFDEQRANEKIAQQQKALLLGWQIDARSAKCGASLIVCGFFLQLIGAFPCS